MLELFLKYLVILGYFYLRVSARRADLESKAKT